MIMGTVRKYTVWNDGVADKTDTLSQAVRTVANLAHPNGSGPICDIAVTEDYYLNGTLVRTITVLKVSKKAQARARKGVA